MITKDDLIKAGFTGNGYVMRLDDDARFDLPIDQNELMLDTDKVSKEDKFRCVKLFQSFLIYHKNTVGLYQMDMMSMFSDYTNEDNAQMIDLCVGEALYAMRYRVRTDLTQLDKWTPYKILLTVGTEHLLKL